MPVRAYKPLIAFLDDEPMLVRAEGSNEIIVPLRANVELWIMVYLGYMVHDDRGDLDANTDVYRAVLCVDAVAFDEGVHPFPTDAAWTE